MSASGILLRRLEKSDAKSLAQYANNINIASYMRDNFPHPYRLSDAKFFIAQANLPDEKVIRGIDLNGEIIGAIGLHPQADIYRQNTEIGYWIGEEHWGNGYATEAVRKILPLALENQNMQRLFAKIFEHNLGSLAVVRKLGFVEEAYIPKIVTKNNTQQGEYTYALRRKNFELR